MRPARPLLALALTLFLAACGGSEEPEPDLSFVSTRDGDYAIYTMSTAGGEERRLTEAEVDASTPKGLFFQTEPEWSPNGRTIAFASKRAGTFDLFAMNADGSGTRRLTSTKEDDGQPTWSPDGDRIAFARGDSARLFVISADGSGARRVTDDEAEENEPAWSPDGQTIAYSRRVPGSSVRELWLVRPDGSDRRRLTSLGGIAQAPAWSPDGRQLAFSVNLTGERFDIYVIGADGKNPRLASLGNDSFEPAWSPDGTTIAFSTAGAISVLNVETDEERVLTDPDNNDSSPAWVPRTEPEDG